MQAVFSPTDMTQLICVMTGCQKAFFRNFELHQISKSIDLETNPLYLRMIPRGNFFLVGLEDNSYQVCDPMNSENQLKVKTTHNEMTAMEVSPNG